MRLKAAYYHACADIFLMFHEIFGLDVHSPPDESGAVSIYSSFAVYAMTFTGGLVIYLIAQGMSEFSSHMSGVASWIVTGSPMRHISIGTVEKSTSKFVKAKAQQAAIAVASAAVAVGTAAVGAGVGALAGGAGAAPGAAVIPPGGAAATATGTTATGTASSNVTSSTASKVSGRIAENIRERVQDKAIDTAIDNITKDDDDE